MSGYGARGISKLESVVIGIIMVLTMLFYVTRLYYLQVVDNSIYSTQADEVSKRRQVIPTRRGEIYDRNFDQPLVTNIDTFAILLDLSEVPADGLQPLIDRLAAMLNTTSDYLWSRIPSTRESGYAAYEIWNGAGYQQIAAIAEDIDNYPGVSWNSRPTRYYPNGAFLSHVLGYTGEITAEELQILYNQGYAGAREVGKTGIERQYDELLRGQDGIRLGRVDARGRRIQELEDIPPVLGDSLVLTIDRHIQELVEMALGNRRGGAVVMDPSNGEIIAMASYPDYDPNIFYQAGEESSIAALQSDPTAPMLNRIIQAAGGPASTFKTIMATAMLQEEAFDPLETINCPGYIVVGDRIFRCHKEDGHGPVNMYQALAESCNVYFYTIGKDYLDVDGIVDYSDRFGLGDYTGVDLPGEIRGLLPDPNWKESTVGVPWVGGDTVNMSIGQGYLSVTPMQMAMAVSAIVNDGIMYQPHILKEVRDQSTQEILQTFEPRVSRDLGIDPAVMEEVRKGMRLVITEGTAQSVFYRNPVELAGKTGTGQSGNEDYKHSWFISYAPYEKTSPDEKQYVVVVWVDATNEWEWWAPKAANIIIDGMINNLTFDESVRDMAPLWYLPLSELEAYEAEVQR